MSHPQTGWSGPGTGAPDAPTQYLPVQGPHPDDPTSHFPPVPPTGRPPAAEPSARVPEPTAAQPPAAPSPGSTDWSEPTQPRRRPTEPRPAGHRGVWILGLLSVAATVLGLTMKEDGHNAWSSVHAWGAVAILGALLTLAPVLARSLRLSPRRAWQVAACGAAALGLFWVLFVLPAVGSNTSLLATIGAAAGIIAVWIAPGREDGAPSAEGPAW